MDPSEREWKRQNRCYELFLADQLSRYEGDRSLGARLQRKLYELEFRFLPSYFCQPPRWRLLLRQLVRDRVLPDFVCVGPVKGGSSDLAAYMLQHPCVLPPFSKEIQGYAEEWRPYFPSRRERERVAEKRGRAVSGNFMPSIHSAMFRETYRAACPEGKVILVLRDPVSRAFSHFKWSLLLGGKRLLRYPYYQSYAEFVRRAVETFPEVGFPGEASLPFLGLGIYCRAVQDWWEAFGEERVYILRAEDFFEQPAPALAGIHAFLDLPPHPYRDHGIVLKNPLVVPPPDPEAIRTLRDFYRPWNHRLYELLGRDLDWQ